jgi:TusE/DsrC/DsvC family sulfur relay protein
MSTRDIAGKTIEFDEDGFMEDSGAWDKDVAVALADEIGITPLSDRHWTVIEFCRADFEKEGEAPTLRRITVEAAVPTKELYKLFPKGPAKKVAYISGLKKPTGCI